MLVKMIMQKLKRNNAFEGDVVGAEEIVVLDSHNKYVMLNQYLQKKEKVVYDVTLEQDSNYITIPCDILRDGGKYEFELISNTSSADEIQILINGLTTGYYQSSLYIADLVNSSHEIVPKGYYSADTSSILGWLYTTNSIYPQITRGHIWLNKNKDGVYKAAYHIEHSCSLAERHSQVNIRGVMAQNFDNITSLTFKLKNNGDYCVGTKLIIRKVK